MSSISAQNREQMLKNQMNIQEEQQKNNQIDFSIISSAEKEQNINQDSYQDSQQIMHSSQVQDSIGKNLTERIQKAKFEIFVQNKKKNSLSDKCIKQSNPIQDHSAPKRNQVSEVGLVKSVHKMNGKDKNVEDDYLNIKKQDKFEIKQDEMIINSSSLNLNQIEFIGQNKYNTKKEDTINKNIIEQENNNQNKIITNQNQENVLTIVFQNNKDTIQTEIVGKKQEQQLKSKSLSKKNQQHDKQNESVFITTKSQEDSQIDSNESKQKRQYKKKQISSEIQEQDEQMKISKKKEIEYDNQIQNKQKQQNKKQQNMSINNIIICNSNNTTPKNISKNIIIQTSQQVRQGTENNNNMQNQTNESQEQLNINQAHQLLSSSPTSSSNGGSQMFNKKGFRQYSKDVKVDLNSDNNTFSTPLIQGLQPNKNQQDSNKNDLQNLMSDNLSQTIEALLQISSQLNPVQEQQNNQLIPNNNDKSAQDIQKKQNQSLPNSQTKNYSTISMNSTTSKKSQKNISKKKNKQKESSINEQIQNEKSPQTPIKNSDIQYSGEYDLNSNINIPHELQLTTSTAPSSSSKKSRLHSNNSDSKSEAKIQKKIKFNEDEVEQEQIGESFNNEQSENMKDVIIPQKLYIKKVTKANNSLFVQLSQVRNDNDQFDEEIQVQEYNFTKDVQLKKYNWQKKYEYQNLNNSKVFNTLWEKQQNILAQISNTQRYQQQKMIEATQNIKQRQLQINEEQFKQRNIINNNQITPLYQQQQQYTKYQLDNELNNQILYSELRINRELSQSGSNFSNSVIEEENPNYSNYKTVDKQYDFKTQPLICEKQINQEDENPETKTLIPQNIQNASNDNRQYKQKFQDLRDKFLLLKQVFKPSIIM